MKVSSQQSEQQDNAYEAQIGWMSKNGIHGAIQQSRNARRERKRQMGRDRWEEKMGREDGKRRWEETDGKRRWEETDGKRRWEETDGKRRWEEKMGRDRWEETDGKRRWEETDGKRQEHVVDDEQPYRHRTAVSQIPISTEGVINQAIQKLFWVIEARTCKEDHYGLQLMELDAARLLTEEQK
jgi:hypothetical protein